MTDEAWLNPTKGPSEQEVAIDHAKSPDFRMTWADGLIGSITPTGLIHFALYAERPAIPRRQVFFSIAPISNGVGQLGAEVLEKQISRGSIGTGNFRSTLLVSARSRGKISRESAAKSSTRTKKITITGERYTSYAQCLPSTTKSDQSFFVGRRPTQSRAYGRYTASSIDFVSSFYAVLRRWKSETAIISDPDKIQAIQVLLRWSKMLS